MVGSCGGGGWCCSAVVLLAQSAGVITPQQETIQEEPAVEPASQPVSPRQISHIRTVREPTVSPVVLLQQISPYNHHIKHLYL